MNNIIQRLAKNAEEEIDAAGIVNEAEMIYQFSWWSWWKNCWPMPYGWCNYQPVQAIKHQGRQLTSSDHPNNAWGYQDADYIEMKSLSRSSARGHVADSNKEWYRASGAEDQHHRRVISRTLWQKIHANLSTCRAHSFIWRSHQNLFLNHREMGCFDLTLFKLIEFWSDNLKWTTMELQ